MKQTTIAAIIAGACLWVGGANGSEQPPADCKPNALNIPGAPYPCVFPDRRVMFRVAAPDAQKVRVRVWRGLRHDQRADGLWTVTTRRRSSASTTTRSSMDGAVVADPATRTFFGSGWYNSAIECRIPTAITISAEGRPARRGASALVLLEGHRRVAARLRLHAAGLRLQRERQVSRAVPAARWGENEQGWHTQGHVDLIMDNLIAEKKAKPMIIVMDNLNAVKPGESAALYRARGIAHAGRWPTRRRRAGACTGGTRRRPVAAARGSMVNGVSPR